jgi:glyoxylase-like metal-dependent hydrolase (beta-lactamase superfamily II)
MTDSLSLTPVADGILQLQLPLPFALRIVNVYLLRGEQGWTIIDCGINTAAGRETWFAAFRELGITPAEIEKIVLTHTHPDHFGLSGWLQSLAAEAGRSVPIYVSPREDEQVRLVWRDEASMNFGDWLMENGMPETMARQVSFSMDDTRAMTLPHPPTLELLNPGETVQLGERSFQIIEGQGHSDGHLLFYDAQDQLLLSGDHVLMKITPNIGLWTQTAPDPLGRFLTSLRELQDMQVRLALPGHKRLVEDWGGRIQELLDHHDERLQHTLDAIADGQQTPYAIAERIFQTERFTAHEWRFAIAETLAHLERLRLSEKIIQRGDQRRYTLA